MYNNNTEKASKDVHRYINESDVMIQKDSPSRNKKKINKQSIDIGKNNEVTIKYIISDKLNSSVSNGNEFLKQNIDFELNGFSNSNNDDLNDTATKHSWNDEKGNKDQKESKTFCKLINAIENESTRDSTAKTEIIYEDNKVIKVELDGNIKRKSINEVENETTGHSSTKKENVLRENTAENVKLEKSNENQISEDALRNGVCIKGDKTLGPLVPSTKQEIRQKTLDQGIQYEESDVKELGKPTSDLRKCFLSQNVFLTLLKKVSNKSVLSRDLTAVTEECTVKIF